jgi:type VII secretion integral membrane protein EccD
MTEAGGDLCRITVVAPRMRLDVAVPQEIPLANLLPTLLWHSGEQLAEEGISRGGWALQRVGEGPLDTGQTMAALGVRDGDILYLRTGDGAAPTPVYDDTADAITSTLRDRSKRWSRPDTRVAALAAVGVLLAAGALALAQAGGALAGMTGATGHAVVPVTKGTEAVIALCAAGLAAVLLAGAAAASRAFGDASLACVIAFGGLPYAFLAGLLALPATGTYGAGNPSSPASADTAAGFVVGATVFLIAAALAVAAVGNAASMVTAAVAVGFAGVTGGLLAVVTSSSGAGGAVVSLALVVTPAIAPIAYRMAKLPKPVVPANPEELRQRLEPTEFAEVPKRSFAADNAVGALICATGVIAVAGVAILLRQAGWAAAALAGIAATLLLLRGRLFTGIVPRAWLIGSGLACLTLLMSVQASRWPVGVVVAVVVVTAVAAGLVARAAVSGNRPSPPVARAVDVAELIATLATVPLALDVLGVFHAVRALGG